MRYLIYVILFCHSFILMNAQEYSIRHIATEIDADGQLDEPVWDTIEALDGFKNFFPINDGDARYDTEVKLFHDGTFLNVAFIYHDTIASVRVNSLKRDNYSAGFHLSDCVGMIIDPYSNQNRAYFFAINGFGAQLDALVANYDDANFSWDAIWESGYQVSGTDKIYEFKIPLSTFSYDENIETWSFQFYTRDAKDRMYTVWNKFERGFLQYDSRFLKPIAIEELQPSQSAKTTLIPAVTSTFNKQLREKEEDFSFIPSLDAQYKITDGMRLDATLNPDFSQVDVDQQVTNLTRFNIVFPERRNFFVENSDMFTTLQLADDINPFFSRFIGAEQDILTGLKLSGNVSPNTRIGVLNVQSKKGDAEVSQNYTVTSLKQQIGPYFNTTGYFINRQSLNGLEFENDYNRVAGLKGNYLSKNRKWSGFAAYSQSWDQETSENREAFSAQNNYNTRTLSFGTGIRKVGENYLADIGFVPRIYNYDALTGQVLRAGYTQLSQSLVYLIYPENQNTIQAYRPVNCSVDAYWDDEGSIYEVNYFYNMALFFANNMSLYINLYYDDIQLKYAFDPLRNDQLVLPGDYQHSSIRFGYNSDYTRDVYGSVNVQFGSFYGGRRNRYAANIGYRLLPLLNLEVNYENNTLAFDDLGKDDIHLMGLTTEIFFNNTLNWTTYLQYNEQIDNFNINTRLQWEYEPLSFLYFVFSDNYSEALQRKNWSLSLKINRRLNF